MNMLKNKFLIAPLPNLSHSVQGNFILPVVQVKNNLDFSLPMNKSHQLYFKI